MTEAATNEHRTLSSDYADAYYLGGHCGPPYTYDEPHWKQFFGNVAESLVATFEPRTAYDAGCAIGLLVRELVARGVDAHGGDISEFAVAGAPQGLRERLEVRDLVDPFDRRFDLITCIEVLEHMSPGDAQLAIANLCAATDVVVLSSTPEDFSEPTHVNVRPPTSWAQDFARHGFFRRTDVDASFLSPWAVVFTRQSPTAVQTVGMYETLLTPVWREVVEKRRALLDAKRELDRARGVTVEERDQLNAEIARLHAEVARVGAERDEAVAVRDRAVAARDRLQDELTELRGAGTPDEQLVRLALVDELIGVKAELVQARMTADNAVLDASVENVRLTNELQDVRASVTWRLGRAALTPVRVARRLRQR